MKFLHRDLEQNCFFLKQPSGFKIKEFPDNVYRLDKVFYGVKQAPRAWYDSLTIYGYKRGAIDNTLFIKESRTKLILSQVYIDDISFGSKNEDFRKEFTDVMSKKLEMSMMVELAFLLGIQVKHM